MHLSIDVVMVMQLGKAVEKTPPILGNLFRRFVILSRRDATGYTQLLILEEKQEKKQCNMG